MRKSLFILAVALSSLALPAGAADKKVVLIAGRPSHPAGMHEFRAGCLLLQSCLANVPGLTTLVYSNGWPQDVSVLDGAAAVVIYADGGGGNPAIQGNHREVLDGLAKKGVGLGFMHYGVEIPATNGGSAFQQWIGGYYEDHYSVNPMWSPDYQKFPDHPIARGVKPFSNRDEWYFNIRWNEAEKGRITPILTATPTDAVRNGPYVSPRGPYDHIVQASGRTETLMWAFERPDGGRGFGFTGGHTHANWGDVSQRKVVLNAILWAAKIEVPKNGVESSVTPEELTVNQDPKGGNRPRPAAAAPASTSPVATASAGSTGAKFKSGVVRSGSVNVDVDLTGAQELYLAVSDAGDGTGCDWADWADAQLFKTDGSTVKLTDLKWKSATTGFGQVGVNVSSGSTGLKIAGKAYANGLGVHAPSLMQFDLPAGVSRFKAVAGLDNGGTDQGCGSTVEFMVFTAKPEAAMMAALAPAADGGRGGRGGPGGPGAPGGRGGPGGGRGGAAPQTHASGPEAALADTANMTPADELDVALFASEPMVKNPTDMDIDAKGRIWIAEGANYRSSFQRWGVLRPEGDRIVILEDTNGDGKADKETVFYQDPSINAALGVCVLGNKVIVSSAPNVFVVTDTDGDGKADKRELMFTGISGFDHDHAIHAFVFGPDGKLYFNFGNAGKQLMRPTGLLKTIPLHGILAREGKWKTEPIADAADLKARLEEQTAAIKENSEPVLDVEGVVINDTRKPYTDGMVFRSDLDGRNVEVLGWNFRNNYEVAVDSFGTMWQSDNDDDGNQGVRVNYVMEYGNYGFKDEVSGAAWGDAWRKAQGKGAKIDERPFYHWHQSDPGVMPNLLQTGQGSPTGIAVYEGQLLPAVFRNQVIHCDAGPRVVRAYPVVNNGAGFTASMTNVLTGPDSWYRPADVCVAPDGSIYIADWHDAGVGGHNMADRVLETMTGRVYHITPKGVKVSAPKLDLVSAKGCVEALQSPNQETRYLAWMKLHEMQGKAEKDLQTLWNGNESRQRARAIQLLARIKGSEKKYVETALTDKDPNLRIVGLRMARSLNLDTLAYVKLVAGDRDPQVRREAAIALRHSKSTDAAALWAGLARQYEGKDRWYVEALGLSADKNEEAFFSAWLKAVGDQWNTPAGRDIVWRMRSTKAPALLVKLIKDPATSEADKARYLRALDFIKGPEKDAALIELLGVN